MPQKVPAAAAPPAVKGKRAPFLKTLPELSRCFLYGCWLPSDLRSGRLQRVVNYMRCARPPCQEAASSPVLFSSDVRCVRSLRQHASRNNRACTGAEWWSGDYVYCNNWWLPRARPAPAPSCCLCCGGQWLLTRVCARRQVSVLGGD